jgi:hypothetical protein
MQPASFLIVAEARMAERLLEVERERLARAAAKTAGSRGRPKPQASSSSVRRLLTRASTVVLAGCLLPGGTVVAQAETHPAGPSVAVPTHVLARASTIAHAGNLLSEGTVAEETAVASARPETGPITALASAGGEAPELPSSPCGVATFGWIPGPATWLMDATLLRAPVLLSICPLP